MTVQEFLTAIEQNYNKYLPQSKCEANFNTFLYNCIHVTCYLSKDQSECNHNILKNDMLNVFFTIEGNMKDLTLDSDLKDMQLELTNNSKFYWIKPESRNYAFGRTDLKFRKIVGNTDKLLKGLDKFFSQLKSSMLDDYNKDLIHDSHIELFKKKLDL